MRWVVVVLISCFVVLVRGEVLPLWFQGSSDYTTIVTQSLVSAEDVVRLIFKVAPNITEPHHLLMWNWKLLTPDLPPWLMYQNDPTDPNVFHLVLQPNHQHPQQLNIAHLLQFVGQSRFLLNFNPPTVMDKPGFLNLVIKMQTMEKEKEKENARPPPAQASNNKSNPNVTHVIRNDKTPPLSVPVIMTIASPRHQLFGPLPSASSSLPLPSPTPIPTTPYPPQRPLIWIMLGLILIIVALGFLARFYCCRSSFSTSDSYHHHPRSIFDKNV